VVTDLADPEPLLYRRGAWRFTLGPHQVGVLGLDYLFAHVGVGQTASISWGNAKKTGEFADVPVIGLSHQWFNNGKFSIDQALPNWTNFVAPAPPQLERQLFWAAEGHHNVAVSLKDRDENRSDDNAFPVLHTRSEGQGFSQIYLVRFLFRSLTSNIAALNNDPAGTRDEVEVFALKFSQIPTGGVSLSEWDRVLCEDFSIFYNDRDLDGILDHLDNCPAVGNPDQGDVIVGLPGDEWADLNLDLKIDGGDLLVAMRAASGDITDPTVLARADVAPARDDKRVDAADVQLMMRAVAGELQAACLGQ
jgi:hypothetical protein